MRVCCISQSVLADDPRVRRQMEALHGAGHEVTAVALAGGASAPPPQPATLISPPDRSTAGKARLAARILAGRALRRSERATFDRLPGSAEFAEATRAIEADLYIANDWRALPAAVAAADRHGARYAYDSHEWAVGEFAERRSWRLVFPRLIEAIESAFVPEAAYVTTVGPGIARLLEDRYHLTVRPTVIRNLPAYEHHPFRPSGDVVTVLYHGQFLPNRGLEQLITSVARWPAHLQLVLRGFAPGDYERTLRELAATSGAGHRITFAGRAPMTELVSLASSADIGIHPLQEVSDQTKFSMPNKLFEYVMAGLAVVTSDLPDMAEIIDVHGVGATMAPTPDGIAAALASFDRDRIDRCKAHAVVAAEALCWERERERLVELVAGVS